MMRHIGLCLSLAALSAPAPAQDQARRGIGVKQKAWTVANFRTGLSGCTLIRSSDGFAATGNGVASFGDRDGSGIDLAVDDATGVTPRVAAHAINTKGTGTSGRSTGTACVAGVPEGLAGRTAEAQAASCSVSGDPDMPAVRFVLPFSAFGASARSYVGHVTLIKRNAGEAAFPRFLSRKGYDHYRAAGERGTADVSPDEIAMTVIASCDTSGLLTKGGKPPRGSYDLAVGTKA
jgi:hypothetical protein